MTMLDSDRLALRGDSSASGTSWGAIFAGAVAALATTLILVVLGGGLGLAAVSRWYRSGAGIGAVGVAAIAWLVVVQWLSSAIGGYMAGRLRSKWTGTIHDDEVFFRDTAHGFLAWCVASVAGAVLLAGAGALALGGAAAGASGAAVGRGADPNAYYVDSLYHPAAAAADANASATLPVPANADPRGETGRILARDLANGGVTPDRCGAQAHGADLDRHRARHGDWRLHRLGCRRLRRPPARGARFALRDDEAVRLLRRRARRALERRARTRPQPLEDDRRRAKAGERRLQHVGADEGGEPEPIGADKRAQRQAQQHHETGKGHNGAVDRYDAH